MKRVQPACRLPVNVTRLDETGIFGCALRARSVAPTTTRVAACEIEMVLRPVPARICSRGVGRGALLLVGIQSGDFSKSN